jgi:hypothetical protein
MDIDIDFADRDAVLAKLTHRVARQNSEKKHNTGVYVTEVPHNPVDNISTIDYKTAQERGYFKLDFLNVSIYKDVKNEQHLISLIQKDPVWELLENEEFVDQVFHLSGYTDLLKKLKPRSVEQLAAALAIIRPAKRHLANESWDTIMREVWVKPEGDSYYFKKAHSFSYAFAVIVHMNLIVEQLYA